MFREKANFSAWLEGIYISRAIAVNFSKNTKYFSEPIKINTGGYEENSLEIKKAQFESFAMQYNKKRKESEH